MNLYFNIPHVSSINVLIHSSGEVSRWLKKIYGRHSLGWQLASPQIIFTSMCRIDPRKSISRTNNIAHQLHPLWSDRRPWQPSLVMIAQRCQPRGCALGHPLTFIDTARRHDALTRTAMSVTVTVTRPLSDTTACLRDSNVTFMGAVRRSHLLIYMNHLWLICGESGLLWNAMRSSL